MISPALASGATVFIERALFAVDDLPLSAALPNPLTPSDFTLPGPVGIVMGTDNAFPPGIAVCEDAGLPTSGFSDAREES